MIPATAAFITANAKLFKQPIFALEIDGYARIFTDRATGVAGQYSWITKIDDHTLSVTDLEGTSALGDLVVTVQDRARALTADLASTVLEGKTCRLKIGNVGMAYADFCTIFTGAVGSVPAGGGDAGNTYAITCQDARVELKKTIYTVGDDGQPIGSDHPKTILANPMDILSDVLLTQVGVASGNVNTTKINAYRDQVFAGIIFEFTLTASVVAKDFIERQIMKPLAGYLRVDALGVLTPQFFDPLPGTAVAVMTLDNAANLFEIPEMQQADLTNVVTMRFDKVDDQGTSYANESTIPDDASVAKYGQQGQLTIEADGVRSAFQGFSIATQTAAAIFARYGDKNPTFEASSLWNAVRLEPGDIVNVTHPLVPNRATGTLGITNKPFEVLNRTWNFKEGRVTLALIDATGAVAGGGFKITADTEAVWTSASAGDKSTLMFISDATGHYSDAASGNVLA